MKTLRHLLLAVGLLAVTLAAHAQPDALVNANRTYQEGDLAGARAILDEAVKTKEHAGTPEAWVLRGFVYKDLYKQAPNSADAAMFRDEAMASLYVSTELDTAKEFSQSSLQAYDFLAKTLYNDAARALNEMDEQKAQALYGKYRSSILRLDPARDLKERDVEFNNALGTVYTKQFNQDRQKLELFDKAAATYRHVLELDPRNYGANYNLATLFYNRGVYNIQRIGTENDIPSIQGIQAVSREFFMQALPYMLTAFEMNPKRKETLLGLEGIYYSLQDDQQSDRYRQLYEALENEPGPDK
jgi:tetratricopeptide (TPR) repeat protein